MSSNNDNAEHLRQEPNELSKAQSTSIPAIGQHSKMLFLGLVETDS